MLYCSGNFISESFIELRELLLLRGAFSPDVLRSPLIFVEGEEKRLNVGLLFCCGFGSLRLLLGMAVEALPDRDLTEDEVNEDEEATLEEETLTFPAV